MAVALAANGEEEHTSAPKTCATSILLNEPIEPVGYMSKPAAAAAAAATTVSDTKAACASTWFV